MTRQNIETIQEILIDAPKKVRKSWKKVKKSYKNNKPIDQKRLKIVRKFLKKELHKYSFKKIRVITKAWIAIKKNK